MKLHGTMEINSGGHLEIGGVDTVYLAKNFGTPLYIVDEAEIRRICREYYRSFVAPYGAEVIYASKAFLNLAMCKIIEEEGLSLDVVSGGELFTAITAQFPKERIYFHGNNKLPEELEMALDYGVERIVVDNFYELDLLNALAGKRGTKVNVLLRISPGIEAHTHEFIQTGQIDSKFGFTGPNGQAIQGVKRCLELPNLIFKGIHCHIGSQVFEMKSFREAVKIMLDELNQMQKQFQISIPELNLGGGFGIHYVDGDNPATILAYAKAVLETVQEKCQEYQMPSPKIMVEPGRSIVGTAGITLYTVGSIKEIPGIRKYVAVDGGMTDNLRPALYQAKYSAMLANRATEAPGELVSITGKCCESGDMLIWDIHLPFVQTGDLLAVLCTGAYNYTMSMNYNRLCRPAVVLVHNGQAEVIVERETYLDLLRNDRIPTHLQNKPLNI